MSSSLPSRICPHCQSPLKSRIHYGMELDLCTACRGIWFDALELSTVLLGPPRRPHAYVVRFNESDLRSGGAAGQACPACRTDSLTRAAWGSVVAAKCRSCQGVWISARSLDALRSQLASLQSPRSGLAEERESGDWEVAVEVLMSLLEIDG
ncbi:MAG: zf-TFIIB domain-containing protein [Gemmatimonadales bacterium]|nr:zf-TFIIB domain-containing protein [Gemmatimonadales bacterium]